MLITCLTTSVLNTAWLRTAFAHRRLQLFEIAHRSDSDNEHASPPIIKTPKMSPLSSDSLLAPATLARARVPAEVHVAGKIELVLARWRWRW